MASVVRACLTGQDAAAVAMEVAARLRQAVAAHAIHALDYQDLLEALLEVQPLAVLDALLEGSEAGHLQGASVFDEFGRHRGNPADVVSCEALIAWCDANRERRYPLAASIITFARRGDASGPWAWSEQATAILVGAPDLKRVLEVFIRRFRPMQWSGSRAALMEANARLLDCLDPYVPSDLMPFVTKTKSQLAQEIARERQRESERDRARDERFEW